MITQIPDLPDGVVGFQASDKVTADDYRDVLDPAIDAVAGAGGKVRLLYVAGPDFESYSGGAMWQDTKLGFHDRGAWERIAVVSSHEHLLSSIRAFAWMVPGEVRTYSMDQLEEAKAWLSET